MSISRVLRSLIVLAGAAALITGCATSNPGPQTDEAFKQSMSEAETAAKGGQQDKAIDLYLTGMQLGSARCAQMVEGFYAEGRLYAPEMLRHLAWTAANGNPAPEADSFLLAFALDLIYGKTDADGAVLVKANQYQ